MEEEPPNHATDVVLMPPQDAGGVTDEDSENEESVEKNPNHLGRGILNQQADLVTFHQEDDYDEVETVCDENIKSCEIVDDKASTDDDVRSHAIRRKGKKLKVEHATDPDDPMEGPSSGPLCISTTGNSSPKRRPRVNPVAASDSRENEDQTMTQGDKRKLPRIKNGERMQSKSKNGLGQKIPPFHAEKWTKTTLPIDPDVIRTPYDYLLLFLPDSCIDNIVQEIKKYAGQKNNQDFGSRVNRNMIRASHAIMYLSGYLRASQRHMYWQRSEDTNNTLVKKAMPRNTFDDVMQYTHFADLNKPNKDDPFWKVAMLFKIINETATKYVERTEYVSVDESMIRYFGPHPLKQFMKGKPTRFGFKVWVMATTNGELITCTPYGGGKTQMFKYGLGQGPDVVYGLAEKADLAEGSKIVVDNLFTSFDLMDNLANDRKVGVLGTMRQIRLYHIDVPSKQEASRMKRGEMKSTYIDEDKVIVTWKDGGPVYVASNYVDIEPVGKCTRYMKKSFVGGN